VDTGFPLADKRCRARLRGDYAQTTSWSAMAIHPEAVALWRDYLPIAI
jgi:hypothetical protein